jgi:hypothetical protein
MSTRAQRQANKRNAQLSTGPRTQEGQARSSRNAIRHNLSGTTFVLLPNEDPAAFDQLARDYRRKWNPQTEHESFLVAQMIQARWRLNRIARMEAELYDAVFSMPFAQKQSDEGAILMAHPLMNNPMFDRLQRYARDAERSYHRAVREMRQAQRAGSVEKPAVAMPATRSFESAIPEIQNEPNAPPSPSHTPLVTRHSSLTTDHRHLIIN